jgi:hypothetical protein
VRPIDVKKIVGDVAAKHGVLVGENDPLMVALSANGVLLEALAQELLSEVRSVSADLHDVSINLPDEASAALEQAAEYAATSVRRGLELDIEGAGLKARAIVDAAHRAQSRVAMWMWIAVGLVFGTALFCAGVVVGSLGVW